MRLRKLGAVFLLTVGLAAQKIPLQAHPIEYHMQPLNAETVDRAISSLELMQDELASVDALHKLQLPDDSLGLTELLWAVQGALMEADEVTVVDSPSLKQALLSAGYADSPYVIETWQGQVERVLETYEVLKTDLSLERIYTGYTVLEKDRPGLSQEQAIERESILVREYELVRTTEKDLDLIKEYLGRLDSLMTRMGVANF